MRISRPIAVVLLFVIMGGVTWLANKLAYEWLSFEVVSYAVTAMMAFAVGLLVGDRYGGRKNDY